MKLRKLISVIAALAMIISIAPVTFAAAPVTSDEYGGAYGYEIPTSADVLVLSSDITINLTKETIYWTGTAGSKEPKFISVNGGTTWKSYKFGIGADESGGKTIAKLLDRGGNISLTDDYDKKTKTTGASVWTFGEIGVRPRAPRAKVYYNPQTTTFDNGTWTLMIDGSAIDASAADKLNIALLGADKKNPAGTEKAWGKFESGKTSVPVMVGSKPDEKLKYLLRTAPTGTTPASKPVKLSVSTLIKAPALKPDFAKNVIKGKADIVFGTPTVTTAAVANADGVITTGAKFDKEAFAAFDGSAALGVTAPLAAESTPLDKDSARIGLDISGLYATAGSDNETFNIGARFVANGKKPASEVQGISIPRLAKLTAAQTGISITKTAVTAKTGFELWNDDTDKWVTSLKNEVDTFEVRQKGSAKYNVKTNVSTGRVTSNSVWFTVLTEEDTKGAEYFSGAEVADKPLADPFGLSWRVPAAKTELSISDVLAVSAATPITITFPAAGTATPATTGGSITYTVTTSKVNDLTFEDDGAFDATTGTLTLNYKNTLPAGEYSVKVTAMDGKKVLPTVYVPVIRITVKDDRTTLTLPKKYEIEPLFSHNETTFETYLGNAILAEIEAAIDAAITALNKKPTENADAITDLTALKSSNGIEIDVDSVDATIASGTFDAKPVKAEVNIKISGNYKIKLSGTQPTVTNAQVGGNGVTAAGNGRVFNLKFTWATPQKTMIKAADILASGNTGVPVVPGTTPTDAFKALTVYPNFDNAALAVTLDRNGILSPGAVLTIVSTYTAEAQYTFKGTDLLSGNFDDVIKGSQVGVESTQTVSASGDRLVVTYKIKFGTAPASSPTP
ncbi:hypothetical protein FACS1894208_03160 [Clostridia bacterium]|nr:hypothetical protein FACS1894208_03160 [Clostridia bacterium]